MPPADGETTRTGLFGQSIASAGSDEKPSRPVDPSRPKARRRRTALAGRYGMVGAPGEGQRLAVGLDAEQREGEPDRQATAGQKQEGGRHSVHGRLGRDQVGGAGDQRKAERTGDLANT